MRSVSRSPTPRESRGRSLDLAAERARERIRRLALLLADGELDREGYDLGCERAPSDL